MDKGLLKTCFRKEGLRLSLPRLLIYQELAASLKPLTPNDLYRCLMRRRRKIGLTSIYRTLELFVSLGMVFKIVQGSNSKYKLCELKDHHHHII
jgi:Fur family ferric uptake transcriptional regulator